MAIVILNMKYILIYLPRILGVRIEEKKFNERLKSLEKDLKIVLYDDNYYLRDMFEAEKLITSRLNILNHEPDKNLKDIDKKIKDLEEYFDIEYNKEQKMAIRDSYLKSLLIITGGPGTGKTTILKAILELYKRVNKFNNEKLMDKSSTFSTHWKGSKKNV